MCWLRLFVNLCKEKYCISSSSSGSRSVPWLGEGLSMPSPSYSVLCCPLPDCVAPVFVQVVSPLLGWSPLSSFIVVGGLLQYKVWTVHFATFNILSYRTCKYMSQCSSLVEVSLRKVLRLPNVVQTCEEVRTSSLPSQQSSQHQDVAIPAIVSQGRFVFRVTDSLGVMGNILHWNV